jgi:hypothetical protein
MPVVLGLATILGITGLVSSFGMLYLGEQVASPRSRHLQTLIYLKLSIAGHLTIFVTRTKGPFWSIKPARILLAAVTGYPSSGDPDCRIWHVYDPPGLGFGRGGLGLWADSGFCLQTG